MANFLALLVIAGVVGVLAVAAWTFARFLYRKLPKRLATIVLIVSALAGFLVLAAAALLLLLLSITGSSIQADLGPSSPCAIEGQPCDAAERETYLAELAHRQVRAIPVFVGWRDELAWGEQTRITAVIASADQAAAEAAIAQAHSDNHVEERSVSIGRKVRAELSGPNVEITKPEQTVRDVTNLQNVTFEWLVKPTRPGKTTLTLRIFNQLLTRNGAVEIERPAMVHEMSVKIGLMDWLTWRMEQAKGLQWAIGGVLAALGLGFANRAKLRRWLRRRQAAHAPASPARPAERPGDEKP